MTSPYDWASFLREWSDMLLDASGADGVDAPVGDAVASPSPTRWLGFAGATEQQVGALEQRLGVRLPPSYRSFLLASDGFLMPGENIPRLYAAAQVDWYRNAHQDEIEGWMVVLEVERELNLDLSDEDADDMLVDLPLTLQVSAVEEMGSAVYLLNPQRVAADGEWEAWMFAKWVPGAHRHDSFWEVMQAARDALPR